MNFFFNLKSQKTVILIGIFWLFVLKMHAQVIKGQVLSLPDSIPVPFATLTNQKDNWGLTANEDGSFEIPQLKVGDTLLVSCLGYYKALISNRELHDNIKLYLQIQPVQLVEAKVKSGGFKDLWLGSRQKRTNSFAGDPSYLDMQEIALWIPNFIQNEGYIHKVGYWIGRFGRFRTPFRVRIYAYDHGMPGEDLLNQNIIVRATLPGSWVDIDVSKYNITLPTDGFFVSLEWLVVPDEKYWYDVKYPDGSIRKHFGQNVGTTREFGPGYVRIRNKSGQWEPYPYRTRNNPRPMFRAQVRVYE